MIKAVYKIKFCDKYTQTINLISNSDYTNIIVPLKDEIFELNNILFKKKNDKELAQEIKRLKDKLYDLVGDNYFTDESILYKYANKEYIPIRLIFNPELTNPSDVRVEILEITKQN